MGISVIPCMGKNNLDRPTAIFGKLQIPTYVIWDGDFGNTKAKPEDNHRLLRLFDQKIEDWPEKVTEQFSCFKQTLNDTLSNEIGDESYIKSLEGCIKEFNLIEKKQAIKNPLVIEKIIYEAKEQGKSSTTLEKIISYIITLKGNHKS
jgi:hypothetical protein